MRDILDFIDIRTIQSPQQSLTALHDDIDSHFDTVLSPATYANVRHELKFHYQPARSISKPSECRGPNRFLPTDETTTCGIF
jgi:hypothetical protein